MNLRRKKPADSLYMLLDTMCNAFGGIILLAVLVVLLTNQEKSQQAQAAGSQDALHHRITVAQSQLDQSRQLESSLQAKAGDPQRKQQMDLLATRKDLQDEIQNTRDAIAANTKDLETANAVDPSERLKFLNARLDAAQTQKREAQYNLDAGRETVAELKHQLASIQQQVAAQYDSLQRPLRLPMEHKTDKAVIYVIVRFGRFYPCNDAGGGRDNRNVAWSIYPGYAIAEPEPKEGLTLDKIGPYFEKLSGQSVYVAFVVFEDSFPAFIYGKQQAVNHGVSYGWEPRRQSDGPVIFGSSGHTPPPQ